MSKEVGQLQRRQQAMPTTSTAPMASPAAAPATPAVPVDPAQCFMIANSKVMSDFNGYMMKMSTLFTDTPTLETFLASQMDSNATYISDFSKQYNCPRWNGTAQRFHNTYFQALLIHYSLTPVGPCPQPAFPMRQVCQASCYAATTALGALFNNTMFCDPMDVAGNRLLILSQYKQLCSTLPTNNCLPTVSIEAMSCGFPNGTDAITFCSPGGAGAGGVDACCTNLAPNLMQAVSANVAAAGGGNTSGGTNHSIIIGAVVAGVTALLILVSVIFFFISRSRQRTQNGLMYGTPTSNGPTSFSNGSTKNDKLSRAPSYIPYNANSAAMPAADSFVGQGMAPSAVSFNIPPSTTFGNDNELPPIPASRDSETFYNNINAEIAEIAGATMATASANKYMSIATADDDAGLKPKDPRLDGRVPTDSMILTGSIAGSEMLGGGMFKMKVVFEYNAAMPDELDMRPGDIVTVTALFDDGWAHGLINDVRGAFPLACVAPLEGTAAASARNSQMSTTTSNPRNSSLGML